MLDKAKQIILNLAIKNSNCERVKKIIDSGNVDLTYKVEPEDVRKYNEYRFSKISQEDVTGLPASKIQSAHMTELMLTYGISKINTDSSSMLDPLTLMLSRQIEQQRNFSVFKTVDHQRNHSARALLQEEETFETIAHPRTTRSKLQEFCLKHKHSSSESFFELFLTSIRNNRLECGEYLEGFLLSQLNKKISDFHDYQNKIFEASRPTISNINTINYCKKFDIYVDRKLSNFISIFTKLETLKYLIEDVEIEVDANECMKRVAIATNFYPLECIKFFIEKYHANNFYETLLCFATYTSFSHNQSINIANYLLQKGKIQLANTNILSEILQKNLDKEFGISWIKFLMQNGAKCDTNDSSIANIIATQCSSQYYWNATPHILYLLELGFDPNLKFNDKTPLEYALIRGVHYHSNIVKFLLIAGADISSFSEQQKEEFASLMTDKILKYHQEIFQKYKKIIPDIPSKNFELFIELVDAFDHSYKSQESLDHHLTSIYNAVVIFNLKSSGLPKHFLDGTYDTLLQQLFQQKTGIVDKVAIHQVKIQMLALELRNLDCNQVKIADALLYLNSKKYVKDVTLAKIVLKVLKSGDELPIWMGVANIDMYLDIEIDVLGTNTEIDKNSIFLESQGIPSYKQKLDLDIEMLNNLERIL